MPGADAAGELQVDDVVPAAGAALVQLGERAEVGVVVGVHGYAEPSLELLAGQQPLPARHDAGPDPGGPPVQRGRDAHPDGLQVGQVEVAPRRQRTDHRRRPVEHLGPVRVDVDQGVLLGVHGTEPVGNGDPDVTVPDVDPGHAAGRRAEPDLYRRSPAAALVRAGPVVGLGDLTGADQLGHQARHRRAGQPAGPDQVGPAHRSLAGEQADDGALVGGAQPFEGAGAGHGGHPRTISAESGGTLACAGADSALTGINRPSYGAGAGDPRPVGHGGRPAS